MDRPDFNLLVTLDVLLTEGSVARAARRLRLSPSAMSRALARLRATTGDPLLVRAGRGLVPTPRAIELRERVSRIVTEADAVLRPSKGVDLRRLARAFTLRTSEGFVETFGPALIARTVREAPGVRLKFLAKADRESNRLREGETDLETGVVSEALGPEIRTQLLFRDRFVGVMRARHPLSKSKIKATRYAAGQHVHVSRRERDGGLIDEALARLDLSREIIATVSGFAAALALVRATDWITAVPDRHTAGLRAGLFSFALPFDLPDVNVSMLWHPRMDSDPAHQWLRRCLLETCREASPHI
jgi:DNA-binding transcriptional LysR family regulator